MHLKRKDSFFKIWSALYSYTFDMEAWRKIERRLPCWILGFYSMDILHSSEVKGNVYHQQLKMVKFPQFFPWILSLLLLVQVPMLSSFVWIDHVCKIEEYCSLWFCTDPWTISYRKTIWIIFHWLFFDNHSRSICFSIFWLLWICRQ
jgi:hypothetical protein